MTPRFKFFSVFRITESEEETKRTKDATAINRTNAAVGSTALTWALSLSQWRIPTIGLMKCQIRIVHIVEIVLMSRKWSVNNQWKSVTVSMCPAEFRSSTVILRGSLTARMTSLLMTIDVLCAFVIFNFDKIHRCVKWLVMVSIG